jgi:hypothetical protein
MRIEGGGFTKNSALKPHRLFIRVAEITISLISDDSELTICSDGEIKKFFIAEVNPDVRVRVAWGDLPEKSNGKKIFDSGSLWQIYSEDGNYFFHFFSSTIGSLPYKIAHFNREFTLGEIYLQRTYFPSSQPIYPLEYPLDELLITNFLSFGRGVEVHACGVMDSQGLGHLFVGQSTAGKSTMARLWQNEPGITLLSDDRIILRKMENTIWMYGTPWHGDAGLASPVRTPLTAVYFLEKGQKKELIPLNPANSITRFFACCFPPFYNRDAIDFTLGFLEEVVKTVPCYELKFTPDKSVVEFIKGEHFT